MGTCIAVAATAWICVLIAIPRKPLIGNEGAELVYAQLLGRQQRLALLATVATGVLLLTLLLNLTQRVDANRNAMQAPTVPAVSCNDEMVCPWMFIQH